MSTVLSPRDLLFQQFNSGVSYKGRVPKQDMVIKQKTTELARYLIGKSQSLDLATKPELSREDCLEVRKRILSLSESEAQKLGIWKSTLRYLKKHARSERHSESMGRPPSD